MHLILVLFLSAIAAYGEISFGTASRIRRGAGAPTSGDCAVASDIGKVYIQSDLGASGSPIFACSQSGASSYSWQQASGGGGGGGGATTALDNLASVSINASLIPQSAKNLGAAATPWQTLYLYGSGTFGTHSIQITGAPTGTRVITLPDVTTTAVGGGQNLTTVGAVPYVSAAGVLNQATSLVVSGAGTTAEALTVYNSIASGVTKLTVKAGAGQSSTNLQEWQNSSGTVLASLSSGGGITSGGSVNGAFIVRNASNVQQWFLDGSAAIQAFQSGGLVRWSSTTDASGSADTSLSRISPGGIVGVGTGVAGSTAGKLKLTEVIWVSGAESTCDSSNRGRVVMTQGSTGVADTFRVCAKNSSDSYVWTALF